LALGARCATEFATPGLHVSIDEFEDPFRGAAKDRSAVEQCDRAGHQCRMLDQQADHVLARGAGAVALCVEIEGLELRVLANELFGIARQRVEQVPKIVFTQRCFEVFDDVELDTTLAKQRDRAA